MILIIYAHPYPDKSRVNQEMLKRAARHPDVVIRSLYELYPTFDIDVEAEQRAVEQAQLVVLQHPMYWYSAPPLLKLWIDKVFTQGWAYGKGAVALKGKPLLWAVTTGGAHDHFQMGDYPGFSALAQPLHATALYCDMQWLEPVVVHGAYAGACEAQHAQIEHYCARLAAWKED
ncbi:glutathione-regulated potassium-efflux system oxidoreductase KefF [Pseudomonas citrulli]|uniref:Glutathione-regulated potassium-efflux system ancillary protein KefF n=1 Tax=Pseudomonas citrulli TaxID=3064347 RepID=A0ABT9BXL6_9PSED|nr:glutathione-regulated potassium-efflux system oxidoreductase KefF [Pseudomonas sp. K18]MDO7896068.1 glutathione-regulated potassium-efflux system oxidoreductase KefF [Pseudomonas sp. K18]